MINIINMESFENDFLDIFKDKIKECDKNINSLALNPNKSNIDAIEFLIKRKKISEYVIKNGQSILNKIKNRIENNHILDSVVYDEDKNNILLSILKSKDIRASEPTIVINGLLLKNSNNEIIAKILTDDIFDGYSFTDSDIPLNIFLTKFDTENFKIIFFKNKINNIENQKHSLIQINNIKKFEKDFKYNRKMLKLHISSINLSNDLKTCHLLKIGNYGNLFSNDNFIYNSIEIIISNLNMTIENVIKNYRTLLKLENKFTSSLNSNYNIQFLKRMYSIDIRQCVIYEDKLKKIKLTIDINKRNFNEILDEYIYVIHSVYGQSSKTDFSVKEYLKNPKDVIENILLIQY